MQLVLLLLTKSKDALTYLELLLLFGQTAGDVSIVSRKLVEVGRHADHDTFEEGPGKP
jgi:hypothetical protein